MKGCSWFVVDGMSAINSSWGSQPYMPVRRPVQRKRFEHHGELSEERGARLSSKAECENRDTGAPPPRLSVRSPLIQAEKGDRISCFNGTGGTCIQISRISLSIEPLELHYHHTRKIRTEPCFVQDGAVKTSSARNLEDRFQTILSDVPITRENNENI